ncbi:ribonuclease H-like [Bufo bufo]|uniref:ribonuclease H-like n=1 Tax=Bufo bufo TaxID=8384 RepID=UPI001ABE66E5|nr:ribonuclease H-like [Bufo bufo]
MSHLAEYLPDLEDKHDCLQLMSQETAGFDHVVDTPLENPDLELFVDGSRYGVQGKFYTGYAVVTQHDTIKAESLPSHMSAQEAELKALEEACRYAEGKTANIYTDSRYAFGITHDYGPIWKARDFLTANGKPIKNGKGVKALMDALLLPTRVAIMKIKGHSSGKTLEARGNHRADLAAKAAA